MGTLEVDEQELMYKILLKIGKATRSKEELYIIIAVTKSNSRSILQEKSL